MENQAEKKCIVCNASHNEVPVTKFEYKGRFLKKAFNKK